MSSEYTAPRFNRRSIRVAAILLGLGLFHILTCLFLVYYWGPPGTPPWLAPGQLRPAGILLAVGGIALYPLKSFRGMGLVLVPVGILLAAAPIYSPLMLVRAFSQPGQTQFVSAGMAAVISTLIAVGFVRGIRASKGSVKGTARWGDGRALRAAETGFILGRAWNGKLLRYAGGRHLMTVAATRTGKGVGTIIPNLLDHPGSLVCTDPKGENWFVTHKYRESLPGHKVIALDPFNLTKQGTTGACNPLDSIDLEDPAAPEIARSMAESLIGHPGRGEDFWVEEAKSALMMFILQAKTCPDQSRQTMGEVRRLISLKPAELQELLEHMTDSEYPAIAEGAARLLQKHRKEFGSVMSTVQSRTHIFSSAPLAKTIEQTSFTKEDILSDNVSIYLIVPREHLRAYAGWLRMTVVSIYGMITRNAHDRSVQPQHRVLFLMDEFANLGPIKAMLDAVSLGAGFGITVWLILQDFAQLKEAYHDAWYSFLANSDVLQVYGIQDTYSCKQVTEMLGTTTVWTRNLKRMDKADPSLVRELNESERPLLTADEIRRLHTERQIIFCRPYRPIIATKIRFYKDDEFKHKAQRNPYVS